MPTLFAKHKNLTFLILGTVIAGFLLQVREFHSFLLHLGGLGYIGAFFAGFIFVFSLTAPTGVAVLTLLSEQLLLPEIVFIGALGSTLGDFIIFKFTKGILNQELSDTYTKLDKKQRASRIFHSRHFSWLLPLIGAAIIASPLPDEAGISILSLSKLKTYQFLLFVFILDFIGIFLLVSGLSFFIK
jgi:hypothetical protein